MQFDFFRPATDPYRDFFRWETFGLDEYGFVLGGIIALSMILAIAIAAYLIINYAFKKQHKQLFSTRDLAYGGICLGLAMALSYISFRMPHGGRATLASSVPIMMFCFFFGFKKGMVVVVAFLAFQFIQGPWIVHFFSAVLDYVIPYMALIFFGVFSKFFANRTRLGLQATFFIAAGLYAFTRYLSHVLSGVIFFADNAWEGWGVFGFSIVYNLTWFAPDILIALVASSILLGNQNFVKLFAVAGGSLAKKGTFEHTASLESESTDAAVTVFSDALQDSNTAKENNEAAATAADKG